MTETSLPSPLDRFVAAVNAGDTSGFLACFAEDAVVDDWGRSFTGHARIKGWSDRELIGAKGVLKVQSVSAKGDRVVLKGNWASKVFTGDSTFDFHVTDGLIREMKITG